MEKKEANKTVTMKPKTKEVNVEVNGEQYRVRKMPAWDGMFLLKFVTEKCLPALNTALSVIGSGDGEKAADEKTMMELTTMIPQLLSTISREDIQKIVSMCLNYTDISSPMGWQRTMVGDNFGVSDLEYDTDTILRLCWESIKLNCGSFFGEGGLNLTALMSFATPQQGQ